MSQSIFFPIFKNLSVEFHGDRRHLTLCKCGKNVEHCNPSEPIVDVNYHNIKTLLELPTEQCLVQSSNSFSHKYTHAQSLGKQSKIEVVLAFLRVMANFL